MSSFSKYKYPNMVKLEQNPDNPSSLPSTSEVPVQSRPVLSNLNVRYSVGYSQMSLKLLLTLSNRVNFDEQTGTCFFFPVQHVVSFQSLHSTFPSFGKPIRGQVFEEIDLQIFRHFWFLGPPPQNMMAPSPALPNLLDGGDLLNPAPVGLPQLQQAPPQINHEPFASIIEKQDFSAGLGCN